MTKSNRADLLAKAVLDAGTDAPLTKQKAAQLVCGIRRLQTAELPPNVANFMATAAAIFTWCADALPDDRDID